MRGIAKYEAVYFVGDNQAINRVRVESYKTRNRGAFSGSLAALFVTRCFYLLMNIYYHLLKVRKFVNNISVYLSAMSN